MATDDSAFVGLRRGGSPWSLPDKWANLIKRPTHYRLVRATITGALPFTLDTAAGFAGALRAGRRVAELLRAGAFRAGARSSGRLSGTSGRRDSGISRRSP